MTTLDFSGPGGERARQRLQDEQVIWLTTVSKRGPRSRPVWFVWHEGGIRVYSQPGTARLRDIRLNPNVSLNLNASDDGQDVVILRGTARLDGEREPQEDAGFVEKYRRVIAGWEPDDFTATFTQRIEIVPITLLSY